MQTNAYYYSSFKKKYKGNPIVGFFVGGGYDFAENFNTPSNGKYLRKLIFAYNYEDLKEYGFNEDHPACGEQNTKAYLWHLCQEKYHKNCILVVNAALATEPPRRGEDRAYIYISRENHILANENKIEKWKITFPGITENKLVHKRLDQERYLRIAIEIILRDEKIPDHLTQINMEKLQ